MRKLWTTAWFLPFFFPLISTVWVGA
jgi:hypothetical protein